MAKKSANGRDKFHVEFLNDKQRMAYVLFQQHDVLFLLGPAGVGKSHLAIAFAISELLAKQKRKIVLTRPIVEAGESLGFLPGDFEEKVNPYMMPLYDCLDKIVGKDAPSREIVDRATEVSPLAYMRGRTFDDAICIFDEAQNSTKMQLKLFLSRLGRASKMIVTGDPQQSDLQPSGETPLMDVVHRLENVKGVGIMHFEGRDVVRHELVSRILEKL